MEEESSEPLEGTKPLKRPVLRQHGLERMAVHDQYCSTLCELPRFHRVDAALLMTRSLLEGSDWKNALQVSSAAWKVMPSFGLALLSPVSSSSSYRVLFGD